MAIKKITTNSIADSAITSAKIVDGTIVDADIDNSTIAQSKTAISSTQPSISSFTPTTLTITSGGAVTVTGTNFVTTPLITFENTSTGAIVTASAVTFTNATTVAGTMPASQAEGTYKVRVENPGGLAAISSSSLTYSNGPTWTTSSGTIATVVEGESVSVTVAATDGSETVNTFAIVSGSLPSGLSLNTTSGAITGTAPAVSSDTTSNFTIRATDDEGQTADRAFAIVVQNYAIQKSLRLNDDDSAFLTFDGQMAAGNRRTFTYSFWTKRGNLGINTCVFSAEASDLLFRFGTSDDVQFRDINNSSFNLSTNNVFRDTAAWYHFVIAVDTTQSTASNRIKFYVNGTQQTTNFGTETYPALNHDTEMNNNGDSFYIGARTDSTTENNSMAQYYDGYISDFFHIDGTAKAPTDFAETDSNGIWKPKQYTGSYGTNGFHLEFKQTGTSADASGKGADTSGQANHFDDNNIGTEHITTDIPTNNFATVAITASNASNYSEGNTRTIGDTGTGNSLGGLSSFGFKAGKWYCEYKIEDVGDNTFIGLLKDGEQMPITGDLQYGVFGGNLMYRQDGNIHRTNGSGFATTVSYGNTFTTNDIIGIAADMDNRNLYFYKNGVIQNSGTAAFTSSEIADDTYYFFFTAGYNDSIILHNYGQPAFSISSSQSDANGFGNFEYSVPSGYYALCTDNIALYGG